MYIKYLLYVLRHKWYVFLECWRIAGALLTQAATIAWAGVTHDMSKLSRAEFGPYARRFIAKITNQAEWNTAWEHHWRNNPHHWVYWVGEAGPRPMPERYRREMLADWRAMSRVFDNEPRDWYLSTRDTIELHLETRAWIEEQLGVPDAECATTQATAEIWAEFMGNILGFVLFTLGKMPGRTTSLNEGRQALERALVEHYDLDQATLLAVTAQEALRRIEGGDYGETESLS